MTFDVSLSGILLDGFATAQTMIPKNMKRYNERFAGGREAVLSIIRGGSTGTVGVYGMDLINPWRANAAPAGAAPAGALQTNSQVFRGDGVTQVFDATGIAYTAFSNYNWHIDYHQFDRKPAPASQAGVYAGWTVAADSGTGTNITFPTETFQGNGVTTLFTTATPADLYFGPGVTFPPSTAAVPAYLAPSVYVGGVLQSPTTYTLLASTPATTEPTLSFVTITFGTAPVSGTNNITIQWAPVNGMEFGVMYTGAPTILWAPSTQQFKRIVTPSYDRLWTVLAATPSTTSVYMDAIGKG